MDKIIQIVFGEEDNLYGLSSSGATYMCGPDDTEWIKILNNINDKQQRQQRAS